MDSQNEDSKVTLMPTLPVLYAEDTEVDHFFMRRAFQRLGIPNPLTIVNDGKEAIDYLSGVGAFSDRIVHPLPCLLILDLNLPIRTGFEVLEWLRQDPVLQDLKAVAISSSNMNLDRHLARKLGVIDYIVKPTDPHKLVDIIGSLKHAWF